MKERIANLSVAKMSAEVADERIDPDAFDGFGVAMPLIELAAALSVPEIVPVGGLIAGAYETWPFDEGFQQHGPVGVAGMPVVGQASADKGECARGEDIAVDKGQDEESGVIDDEMQITLTLIVRPADELIARLGFPGTGAEGKQSNDLIRGAYEVAQL